MIYAMKYLRGEVETFEKAAYDFDAISPWEDRIDAILRKRQLIASGDWKEFGEELSGCEVIPFDIHKYQDEYSKVSKEL